MNMHYLDNMFPLKPSPSFPHGGIGGSGFDGVDEDGEFMNSILDLTPEIPSSHDHGEEEQREGAEISCLSAQGKTGRDDVLLRDFSPSSTFHQLKGHLESGERGKKEVEGEMQRVLDGMRFRTKDMSRLWLYINGRSPPLDEVDVSLARMATI